MMEIPNVAVLIWVCALIGFAAYCITCASHVWWRRNSERNATPLQERLRSGRAFALITCAIGVVGMFVVAAAVHLSVPSGELRTKDLSTVRKKDELRVTWATDKTHVKAGDVIARFSSPEVESQIEVLKNKKQALAAAHEALQVEPLKPDEEITRKILEASSEYRHAEALRGDLILECGKFERDFHHDQLVKRDDLNRLNIERNQIGSNLIQARAKLRRAQMSLKRTEALYERGVTTTEELEQQQIEVQVLQEDVAWSEAYVKRIADSIQEMESRLAGLIDTNRQRHQHYEQRIAALDRRAAENQQLAQALKGELKEDLQRAQQHRAAELAEIEAELQQAEAEMQGYVAMLLETAPADGEVIFRSDSPALAKQGEPFLMVSPEAGLRCQLRIPAWQKACFADNVTLELISAESELLPRFLVNQRFSAELIGWHDLPDDPTYAIVELRCNPPVEAIRHLADGQQIRASLLWTPPMMSHPTFRAALGLFCMGAVAWVILSLFRSIPVAEQEAEVALPATLARPEAALAAEYGSEGAMLHVLGSQLKEAITRRQIDVNLISAAEWALDRYRARAVRLIGIGLGHDAPLLEGLHELWKSQLTSETNTEIDKIDVERQQNLIRTVADKELRIFLKSLPQDLHLEKRSVA